MKTLFDEAQYLLREAHRRNELHHLEWEISEDAENEMARLSRPHIAQCDTRERKLFGIPYIVNHRMIGQSVVLLRPQV